jgi:bifunctional non-homologous end joining protein LigD
MLERPFTMSLNEYRRKRHFDRTTEPAGEKSAQGGRQYLIQKHAASHLHFDFRLELDGVLLSWAVPKGPSLDPSRKSLAVHVEDHPLEYGSFEGTIPEGEYGGGTVMLWDRGTWEPEGDAAASYRRGKLVFQLNGERLKGRWALIRMGGKAGQDGKNWLLKKLADNEARKGADENILDTATTSVITGRTMDQIAHNTKSAKKSSPKVRRPRKSTLPDRPDHKIRKRRSSKVLDPSALAGARGAAMPAKIAPELPTLVEKLPEGPNWLHELKLDGYRMIGFVRDGNASLYTRRGHDWTHRFPTIAGALEELADGDLVCDGEIVVLGKDGTSDFQALQNVMRNGADHLIVYFVFDLLFYRGRDLRQVALIERKQLLSRLLELRRHTQTIRFSDHIAGDGNQVFSMACREGLEGIVAKRNDSHYTERRTTDWVKVKCKKRQEFVVGGWTEPGGGRESLGALLVGYHRSPTELVYCGRVGTGFTEQSLRDLRQLLEPLEQQRSPFHEPPAGVAARGLIHWVKPKRVVEVAFAAWTADGLLRHASFQGVREDKAPTEITPEVPIDKKPAAAGHSHHNHKSRARSMATLKQAKSKPSKDSGDVIAGVRLTHPDRVLFPDEKITKRDLAVYYTAVAPVLLPHVVGRPLSLVRCPGGRAEPCFYQKHLGEMMPKAVHGIAIREKSGTATYIAIDDLAGLISLVQMGVLEIHPWGCRADRIDRPDRLIFDIDPAPDVAWAEVVRAAWHVKERLVDLEIESFVRTTGGKGLHVVVPLVRRVSWDDLKALARAFADALVREQPEQYIAQASKIKRAGKIYIDYLRNEKGATAIASYSTRARAGATVATPLSWDELSESLRPDRFNARTVPERLGTMKQDPWQGFFEVQQSIARTKLARVKQW